MPTYKQKNLAKLRLENPKLNKVKLVELGGYGKSVIKTPAKALESKGYKEELGEYGLTEQLISESLVSDIKAKPKNRKPELDLGADILGMKKKPDNYVDNRSIVINITDEKAKRIINRHPEVFTGS